MTTYVLCKTLVPWLCSRSQPGIKVIIRGLRGHLLPTVTFFVHLKHFVQPLKKQAPKMPDFNADQNFAFNVASYIEGSSTANLVFLSV